MPYSNNSGGPWGGGGNNKGGGGDDKSPWGDKPNEPRGNQGGPQRPGSGQGVPDIDDLVRKGQEQLKVLLGGRSGGGGPNGTGGGGGGGIGKGGLLIAALVAVGLWALASFYRVDTSEQSVELLFGEHVQTGTEGLNFAPWPFVTKEILPVTRENTEQIGVGRTGGLDEGLMLTGDENIVDIDFEVVWNINDPAKFLFNLAEPQETIRAVSESAMREVIARSLLAPILNRDRGIIADEVEGLIQQTLDSYESGVSIVRLNMKRADPPEDVIDDFRDVQAAEQERDTLEKQADAYANQALAGARGDSARFLQEAEGYRAQVINEAQGEASRFVAVFDEYAKAPEVTRKRLYLETMERVFSDVEKIIVDGGIGGEGGSGVVPYLPLNELNKRSGGTN
jgi:membrane protease subunit HflK